MKQPFLRAWLFLLLALGGLLAAGALTLTLVPIRADLSVLMPEKQSRELEILFSALQEGPANRLILIGLRPKDGDQALQAPADLSRAFKAELRKSGFFEQVLNGEVSLDRSSLDPFFAHRYHLNPPLDPESFSVAGLRRSLEALLSRLQGLEAPVVEGLMADDPTLRTLEVAALWRPASVAERHQGVWLGSGGSRVLLLARIRGSAFAFRQQEAMIKAVSAAAERLQPRYGPLELSLSGPSVIAADSRLQNEAESQRLILICVPLVIGLLFVFFRRPAVILIALMPLMSGLLAGTLAVAALFGFVHVTTLGFGVTLIGVSVDYPLHLVTRLRAAGAMAQGLQRVWPALALGVLTTIVGFLPMVLSSFPGVAQLGIFTLAGLATAAAVTRWFLPLVAGVASGSLRTWVTKAIPPSGWPIRRLRPVAVVAGLAALTLLTFRGDEIWQQDLAALSPLPEEVRAKDEELRRDLRVATPRSLLTIDGESPEQVLIRSEALLPLLDRLEAEGALEGFDLAARYLPSAEAQQTRLSHLPAVAELRQRLETALEGLPFKPGAFEPFLEGYGTAKASAPLRLADMGAEDLRLRLRSLLLERDGGATGLVSLRGAPNFERLEEALAEAGVAGVRLLDVKRATQNLMDAYLRETLVWASLGGLLGLLLLSVALRSARAVAQIALPAALSVLLTAAVMVAAGQGLSLFQVLALLMVAGLGIDYSVFLRQRDRKSGAADREGPIAVCLCAVTSFCVFAVLASASIPLLAQIGLTAALGTLFSLLLSFVFAGQGPAETP